MTTDPQYTPTIPLNSFLRPSPLSLSPHFLPFQPLPSKKNRYYQIEALKKYFCCPPVFSPTNFSTPSFSSPSAWGGACCPLALGSVSSGSQHQSHSLLSLLTNSLFSVYEHAKVSCLSDKNKQKFSQSMSCCSDVFNSNVFSLLKKLW